VIETSLRPLVPPVLALVLKLYLRHASLGCERPRWMLCERIEEAAASIAMWTPNITISHQLARAYFSRPRK
jgi:hypothetical protein